MLVMSPTQIAILLGQERQASEDCLDLNIRAKGPNSNMDCFSPFRQAVK